MGKAAVAGGWMMSFYCPGASGRSMIPAAVGVFSRHARCEFGPGGHRRIGASRGPKAVETYGVIRKLGVAEVERAAGEGVGLQRLPHWVGQIRGRFHDDRE